MTDKQPQSQTLLHREDHASSHLIHGAGEMSELVRAFDWSTSPLGPIATWSQPLLAVVNLMLSSPIPTALYWGLDRILLYNDGFRAFTGQRHPQSLGASGSVVWKESWHLLSTQADAVFANGQVTYEENFYVPLEIDGRLQDFYWTYSFSPVYDNGAIAGIFNVCQNTTENLVAETNLRESESRALRILESIGDAVIVTNAEGNITRMNPVAEELTGWSLQDAVGDRLADVFHIVNESSRAEVENPADKVRRLGTIVGLANHTILIRRDGSEIHIDDSGAPIRNDRGDLVGVVLVFRNIGERKQLERERELAAAREREIAARQQLQLKLMQSHRETTDTQSMMLTAAEAVGRHLGVDRTGFFHITDETIHFIAGWTSGALPPLSGSFPTSRVGGALLEEVRSGKVQAVSDTATHPLTKDLGMAEAGIYSDLAVPVLRHGKWQGGFFAHGKTVREWTKAEIALTQEVVNQTFESVELALTQQAVLRSEARFRNILESIGDAVIVKDTRGHITHMNPVAEELTGWRFDDAKDHTVGEVFHLVEESTHKPIENPAETVRRSGTAVRFDARTILIRRDGREMHIDGSGGPIRDEQGELIGIVFVFRNMEEQRRMEQELARSAARDREIAATQALLVKLLHAQRETTDPTAMMLQAAETVGRHLAVDRTGFFEMLDDTTSHLTVGWTAGELPLLSGLVPIGGIGEGYLAEARAGKTSSSSDYENDPLTRDSGFAQIGVRSGIGVPILRYGRWQSGFYVHCARVREWSETEIAFVREVANQTLESVELALAQQAVRRSEARLTKILESIGDAVIVTDVNRTITGLNPVAEQLTGWPEDEARGVSLAKVVRLVDEETGETIESALESLTRPGTIKEIVSQATLVRRDGVRLHIDQSGSPIREDDGGLSGMVLIFRDITNRNTTERRLRQAYKMEALGQLTGGIAHDFNNILAIIMGNLELIAEATDTNVTARERIEQAVASAERAADLTRRLLAYARQQPLDPAVVDVVTLIHAATEFIRRSLGPTIVLDVSIADGLWSARIDRNQFENALLNLAVNARDAMPGGGHLQINCGNTVIAMAGAETGEITPGEYLLISVTDTGTGMSPEALVRATEPFFTTKPIGQGTGLGLSMVYGFLKQSGGHMQIESELSVGTRVLLYLPRSIAAARQLATTRASRLPEPLPRGTELILVVEDELAIRRTISYLLNSLGYRVLEAEDGPNAMLLLTDSQPIDLMLTDVILPNGISGAGLANEARSLQPAMKVIFSSGYTSNVLTRDFDLQDGVHLLNKPFHLADLAKMVRAVLDHANV